MMSLFKNKYERFDKVRGYTLIELLIVMSLMALILSLVAPLSFHAIEKSNAKSEYLELVTYLSNVGNKAFLEGQEYHLKITDDRSILSTAQSSVSKTYQYLKLEPVNIRINRQGYAVPGKIKVYFKGQNREIELNAY